MTRMLAPALSCALFLGCRNDERIPPVPTASTASVPAAPCAPRSAEKLGFPFVRVCPPGEAGFWINAAPMGCSAGEHDTVRCPEVTALVHGIGANPAAIRSSLAAVIDADTASRLCFFRMGGRLPSRAERSKARAALGLATVIVTESEKAPERFRFEELPEWVTEESGEKCENALAGATCHFGWFPSDSKSPAISWPNIRECQAQYHATPPAGVPLVRVSGGCAAPAWSWALDASSGPRALPCGLRSPGRGELAAPSAAAFTIACYPPKAPGHPAGEDKDTAAYRCVLPESALGTFDLPGR